MDPSILPLDDVREWIQFWIEDEENYQYRDQWYRDNCPHEEEPDASWLIC